jgi:hypothetical protein
VPLREWRAWLAEDEKSDDRRILKRLSSFLAKRAKVDRRRVSSVADRLHKSRRMNRIPVPVWAKVRCSEEASHATKASYVVEDLSRKSRRTCRVARQGWGNGPEV